MKREIFLVAVMWSAIAAGFFTGAIWWDLDHANDLGAKLAASSFFLAALVSLWLAGEVVGGE